MATNPNPISRAWKACGHWVVLAGMVVVVVLIVAVGRASALLRAKPAWWQEVSAEDPEVIESGQRFENALISNLYSRRESGEENWKFGVPSDTVNSWLSTRLPKWVAMQVRQELEPARVTDLEPVEGQAGPSGAEGVWPSEIREVQVSFADPHIYVGARVEREGREQYLSATLRPEIRADGSLWLVASRVYIGRLGMPASWVLAEADGRADELLPEAVRGLPEAETVFKIFMGDRPFSENPEIRLSDGRRVRLTRLSAIDKDDKQLLVIGFETIMPNAEANAGG